MRVTASTAVGESALLEENDVFVRTPEDGNTLFAMMTYFRYWTLCLFKKKTSTYKKEGTKCIDKTNVEIISLLSVTDFIQTIFR